MAISSVDNLKLFLGLKTTEEDARLCYLLDLVTAGIKEFVGRDLEQATYTEYYSGDGRAILQLRQRPVTSITSICVDSEGYYGQAPSAFPASLNLVAGTDYALVYDTSLNGANISRAGNVERIQNVWPLISSAHWEPSNYAFPWQHAGNGRLAHETGFARGGNIKVVYVAGYSAANLPKDLALAVNLYASGLRRSAIFGGASPQSETLGEYSYSLFGGSSFSSGSLASGASEIGSIRQILSRYREVAF